MNKLLPALILSALSLHARAQIAQTTNNVDWDSAAYGGAAPVAGQTYTTAPGLTGSTTDPVGVAYSSTLRVNDVAGGDNGFAGASLTVAGSTRLLLKVASGDAGYGNLILNNNSNVILATTISGTAALGGTVAVPAGATAYLGLNNGSTTNLNVNSTLTGSGTLALGIAGTGAQSLNLDGNLSGFNGNLSVYTGGVFSVGGNFTLNNTALNITSTAATFNLDDTLTVKSLSVLTGSGTYNFAPGTYTPAQADAKSGTTVFQSAFQNDGGSITVAPEPQSVTLILLGLCVGGWAWRRSVKSS